MLLLLFIFLLLELIYLICKFLVLLNLILQSILSFITLRSLNKNSLIINLIFFFSMYVLFLINIYIYVFISVLYCIYLLFNGTYLMLFDVLSQILLLIVIASFLGQIFLFNYFNIFILLKIFYNWYSSTSTFFISSINTFNVISSQYLFTTNKYIENVINKREYNTTHFFSFNWLKYPFFFNFILYLMYLLFVFKILSWFFNFYFKCIFIYNTVSISILFFKIIDCLEIIFRSHESILFLYYLILIVFFLYLYNKFK